MLFWLNYILLPPHPLQPTPSLGIAKASFGYAEAQTDGAARGERKV